MVLTPIAPIHYLVVSALLLATGIAGVLLRRNLIVVLMSIELILNAVNINLAVFSRMHGDASGQAFALLIMAVAVSETAVGLALLIALFRNRGTVQADELDLLKW
jgi:NADH-quinone oxidoreductase subunit K